MLAVMVKVPKASMHKNDFALGTKNQIWLAGQVLGVKTVTVTHSVDQTTNSHFRLGITRPDKRHSSATLRFSKRVHRRKTKRGSVFWLASWPATS